MKNGAEKPQMAHVNGICAGLVGPKSENIKKASVLLLLSEGSRVQRGSSEKKQAGGPYHVSLKIRRAYIQNCVSCVGGDDIFRKIMKKVVGK